LKFFRGSQDRTLASREFIEFPQDIPKVPLKIFLHRTTFAVPLRVLIGRGGQPVVGAAEKILPER
jgi:hypothetical protein